MLAEDNDGGSADTQLQCEDAGTVLAHEKVQPLDCKVSPGPVQGALQKFEERIEKLVLGSDGSDAEASPTCARALDLSATSSLEDRMDKLETTLTEVVDRHRFDVSSLKTGQTQSTNEAKARDALQTSITERLGYMERVLAGLSEAHTAELTAALSRLDQADKRLSACEAFGAALGALEKSQCSLVDDKNARDTCISALTEQMAKFEEQLSALADGVPQLLGDVTRKIHELQGAHVADISAVREEASKGFEACADQVGQIEKRCVEITEIVSHNIEEVQAGLAAHVKALQEQVASTHGAHDGRIEQIEKRYAEFTENFNQMIVGTLQKVDHVRSAHVAEVKNLQKLTDGNFSQHYNRITALERGQIEFKQFFEQRLLDACNKVEDLQRKVDDNYVTLLKTKIAENPYESNVKDSACIAELERSHVENVEILDQHSRAMEDVCQKAQLQQDALAAHVARVERWIADEKKARSRQDGSMQDTLKSHQSWFETQTELVCSKHQDAINQRVDSLQRSLTMFETLISHEIEERAKDNESIWQSIRAREPEACASVASQKTYRTTCRLMT